MVSKTTFVGFLYILLLLLLRGVSLAQPAYVDGEIIVKLKKSVSQRETHAFKGKAQKGLFLKNSFHQMNMYHYALKPGKSVEQVVEELQKDPNVEYAEPNYILSKASLDNKIGKMSLEDLKTLSREESYLPTDANIRAVEVWETLPNAALKSNVPPPIVAVIDTGLDITHKTFVDSGVLWTNPNEIAGNNIDDDGNGYVDDVYGWNFIHNSGTIIDDDGHGTHVSGIVLGVGQDIYPGEEERSISQSRVQIMPLKFLDKNGIGNTSDAISAIHYAIENGARILNSSWGGPNYSAALHEAVAYTYHQGVVFVAAAGNSGEDNDFAPIYPASYEVPHVMSIAATTSLDKLASFSNFGVGSVDLGSPGVLILSTLPNNSYGISSGTSMAAPFVSGVAALMLLETPNMLGHQIKSIIFQEADHIESLVSKISQESRLNVESAINFARQASVESTQPEYTFTSGDRSLASLTASGGCGTVAKMNSFELGKPFGKSRSLWGALLFLSLLSLPVLLTQWFRRQRRHPGQRKHDRFKIDSEIKVNIGGEETGLVGSISTISLGGMQLNTEAMLEQGGVVTMNVTSPNGKEQIQVEGCVVWRREKEAYGVQFAKAEESTFQSISQWATSLVKI